MSPELTVVVAAGISPTTTLTTYAPGADMGTVAHTGQEGGIVVCGEIGLTVAGRTRVLQPGDGYYFDSHLPHRFRNRTKEEAQLISALTPPTH